MVVGCAGLGNIMQGQRVIRSCTLAARLASYLDPTVEYDGLLMRKYVLQVQQYTTDTLWFRYHLAALELYNSNSQIQAERSPWATQELNPDTRSRVCCPWRSLTGQVLLSDPIEACRALSELPLSIVHIQWPAKKSCHALPGVSRSGWIVPSVEPATER